MAIMRSEVKKAGGNWLGVKTGTLSKITCEKERFSSWAEVYLKIEFTVEGSEYPRTLKICGSFDKETNGQIKDCTLLKHTTWLLDSLGEQGGINHLGKWVDANEHPIENIVEYLNKYIGTKLTIFVYKELSKNGQTYTTVHNKVMADTPEAPKELQGYIDFLRSKGYIKEAPENMTQQSTPVVMNGSGTMSDIDIANL